MALGRADPDATRLTVSLTGGFALGPFSAVVEHMGVQLLAAPATLDARGDFGLLDLSFGFKPPDGIAAAGMELSASLADLVRTQNLNALDAVLERLSIWGRGRVPACWQGASSPPSRKTS